MAKSKKQRILDIYESDARFTASEIAFRVSCSHAYAVSVLHKAKCDRAVAKPTVLHVNLPAAGTEVQVRHKGKLIASLVLSVDGLVLPTLADCISPPRKPIPWKDLLIFQKLWGSP